MDATPPISLRRDDHFIIGFDISGSMGATDCPGGQSRFHYALDQVKAFAAAAGQPISFYPFGSALHPHMDLGPDDIQAQIGGYRLEGATLTHLPIAAALKEHADKDIPPTTLLLIVDGEPSDPETAHRALADAAIVGSDKFEVIILTVGRRSPGLEDWIKAEWLDAYRLEDIDLAGALAAVE